MKLPYSRGNGTTQRGTGARSASAAGGPTLAGEAVTDPDPQRIAFRRHPELAAAAYGLTPLHDGAQ
jgi:hypothetical protein